MSQNESTMVAVVIIIVIQNFLNECIVSRHCYYHRCHKINVQLLKKQKFGNGQCPLHLKEG